MKFKLIIPHEPLQKSAWYILSPPELSTIICWYLAAYILIYLFQHRFSSKKSNLKIDPNDSPLPPSFPNWSVQLRKQVI